ncbi:MAG: SAM-dependent methyltransferase [Ferruginibacter sp.]
MADLYLIPCSLAEEADHVIPAYVMDAVRCCNILFVENERTARRFLKRMDTNIEIDAFVWHTIGKQEHTLKSQFDLAVQTNQTIGILSEAGCPGIADPGQQLVAWAQLAGCVVKPLVGPSSILLALMASGMNGQSFSFHGYLPVDHDARNKKIRDLETVSRKVSSTCIFIETPYRNQSLFDSIVQQCATNTRLCIAMDITGKEEWIRTKTIQEWRNQKPEWKKIPAIFLLQA